MTKDNIALFDKDDLKDFMKEVVIEKFSYTEVDTHTVRQILKISQSTVNRYVENGLLKVTNQEGDRRFNLADILYINKEEIKRENRLINRTQVKPTRRGAYRNIQQ